MLKDLPQKVRDHDSPLTLAAAGAGTVLALAIFVRWFYEGSGDVETVASQDVIQAEVAGESVVAEAQTLVGATGGAGSPEVTPVAEAEIAEQVEDLTGIDSQLRDMQTQLQSREVEAEVLINERERLMRENERLRNEIIVPLEQQLAQLEASQDLNPAELQANLDNVQGLLDKALNENETINAQLTQATKDLAASAEARDSFESSTVGLRQELESSTAEASETLTAVRSQLGLEIDELKGQTQRLDEELNSAKTEQERLITELAGVRENNASLAAELEAAAKQLEFNVGEKNNLTAELGMAKQNFTAFEAEAVKQASDKQAQIYRLEEKLALLQSSREETVTALDSRIATLVGNLEQTTSDRSQLNERLTLLQSDSEQLADVQAQLADANVARTALEEQVSDLQGKLAAQEAALSDTKSSLETQASSSSSIQTELNETKAALEAKTASSTAMESQLSELSATAKQLPEVQQQLESRNQELADMESQRDKLQTQLNDLQAQLNQSSGDMSAQINSLRAQSESTIGERDMLSQTLAALNLELDGQRSAVATESKKLEALQLQFSDVSASAEDLKTQLADQTAKNTELAAESQSLVATVEKWQATAAELTAERDELNTLNAELTTQVPALKQNVEALKQEVERLTGERETLSSQLGDLNSSGAAKIANLDGEIVTLRDTLSRTEVKLAETQSALASADGALKEVQLSGEALQKQAEVTRNQLAKQLSSIKGVEVLPQDDNSVVIKLASGSLYGSGRADLSAAGLRLMGQVGKALKGIENKLNVEGHTDNIPLAASSRNVFPSNWELSSARANSATRYLQDSTGIDASRLAAIGYGEHRPIAPNDTRANRGLNRRVEIRVLPLQ